MDRQPIVWKASDAEVARSRTADFMARHSIDNYQDLVGRSIADLEWFWEAAIGYLGIPFSKPYHTLVDTSNGIQFPRWFSGGEINLSEVCVDRWAAQDPERTALVAEREDGTQQSYSFAELLDMVERAAGALAEAGAAKGDTVAVYLPMTSEAVVSMLAAARIGAIYVPIFSGFGTEAVASRLEASQPAVMVTADGYTRRGGPIGMKETADRAIDAAGVSPSVIVVSNLGRPDTPWTAGRDRWWEESLETALPMGAVATGSEDPVLLAYTSGTTGKPKGVVHVHGGLAVKLAVEGAFQFEVAPGDRVMWMTDMGWIMGPWMVVAGLGNGASLGCYDGAPDYPTPGRTWQLVESLGITVLGISPTLIRALQPHGAHHASECDLSTLRAIGSTGEPWNPDPWWWLFREIGGEQIPIINISGGTEVGACLLSVNILQGIKPTSLGGPSLGMAMDVYDQAGNPLRGEVGELVCSKTWPGITRGFWGTDDRYLDTYWNRWPDIWVHGDWASVDEDGFWYLHGRSDDTLSIAGKRIGPAEIESAVVAHPDVVMAAAIGVPHPVKGEAIAVYAVPTTGTDRSTELAEAISGQVVDHLGKAFRPLAIELVDDLPRTRSAKIMRRVVRARALGEEPGDLTSLENPAAVDAITRLDAPAEGGVR
ncbi:MAG: AMP-binding protein [bacterium]|nr:AMP-binding protein [bacterium]